MTTDEILSRTKCFAQGGQGQRLSHANSNFNRKMRASNSFDSAHLTDHREKAN